MPPRRGFVPRPSDGRGCRRQVRDLVFLVLVLQICRADGAGDERRCQLHFAMDDWTCLPAKTNYSRCMAKKAKMKNYTPTPDELKKHASLFWPKELLAKEVSASIIPVLVGTQDKFISILDIADKSPDTWKTVLCASSGLKANVFLKHLMVLADVGGEPLKRLHTEFARIFPNGSMTYVWQGKTYNYQLKEILGKRKLDNSSLFVDGPSLAKGHDLDGRMEDIIMLLLFGAAIVNAPLPQMIGEKCTIGTLIGKKAELQKFVKQRYIFVSRITGGATSNALGQIAQDYVRDLLCEHLPKWKITRNGTIAGISHNAGATDMNSDVFAIAA